MIQRLVGALPSSGPTAIDRRSKCTGEGLRSDATETVERVRGGEVVDVGVCLGHPQRFIVVTEGLGLILRVGFLGQEPPLVSRRIFKGGSPWSTQARATDRDAIDVTVGIVAIGGGEVVCLGVVGRKIGLEIVRVRRRLPSGRGTGGIDGLADLSVEAAGRIEVQVRDPRLRFGGKWRLGRSGSGDGRFANLARKGINRSRIGNGVRYIGRIAIARLRRPPRWS